MSAPGTGPMDEGLTPVNGAELSWTITGSGPVTLYAHGLTQSRASETASGMFDWTPVAAVGRRLVRYDARGHGRSSGAPVPADYTWPSLAGDLLALADELSPGAPISAIGSSMGTGTLLHAAVRSPGRFDALVLTAPPTAWATRAGQAGMYQAGADLIEEQGQEAFQRLVAQAPVPAVFAGLPAFPPPPDVAPGLLPSILRGAGASDLPAADTIAALDLPVLILAWAGDSGHPLSTAERLTELIPGARMQVAETTAELLEWGEISAAFLRR